MIASDLVYPMFVTDDHLDCEAIPSLPGQFRWGWLRSREILDELVKKGLRTVLLFGVYTKQGGLGTKKDMRGSIADDPKSPVVQAIEMIRKYYPDLTIMTDVCMCHYTDHGHCGIINERGYLDNESSAKRLAEIAGTYAEAGAHVVAPSDMMDGRIGAIKDVLFQKGLLGECAVMSYAAKYSSCMYGPFRDAAGSGVGGASVTHLKDRSTYQLPPPSRDLGKLAVRRDIEEGADFVMVKPAGPYLDIIRDTAEAVNVPVACYQVSGEYAMIYHGAKAKSFDLRDAVMESLQSCKRAGAQILITYYAPRVLDWLAERPSELIKPKH